MKLIIRSLCAATAAAAILALTGCAAPANKEQMEAAPLTTAKRHPYTLSVQAQGGAETGAMDSSNIANTDLKAAIEASIAKSQLFKAIVAGKDGDYELNVSITQLSKPAMGFSFTVDMECAWSLTKVSDRSVAMRKVIRSTHTAGATEAFVGAKRLQLAVEGAVRNNIAQGLKALADLPL
jgi:hypothetical protein